MEDGRAAMWTMVGVAVSFKLWGAILILSNDHTREGIIAVLALHWPFFLPVFLLIAPAIWWFRLIRGRIKRARLLHQEWHVDEPTSAGAKDR